MHIRIVRGAGCVAGLISRHHGDPEKAGFMPGGEVIPMVGRNQYGYITLAFSRSP